MTVANFPRWLIQECDAPTPEEALLFVHIPRSGGTSLNEDFKIPQQTRRGRHCFHSALLTYFFYRYRLLEKSNFPFRSWENLYVLCSLTVAITLALCFAISIRLQDESGHLLPWAHPLNCQRVGLCLMPYLMMGSGSVTFFISTFVATAPSLRSDLLRRFYLWFWHLTGAYSTSVISGTNKNGFLMHLTAEEMLRHGYVTEEQLLRVSSFAIVRNPYARMGSVYMYNRLGRCESFPAYIRRCHCAYRKLCARGQWGTLRAAGEWGVFCHRLPAHAFTHDREKQLVAHVVRMEEIALLSPQLASSAVAPRILHRDSKQPELPPVVRKAILGMSRTNARPLPKVRRGLPPPDPRPVPCLPRCPSPGQEPSFPFAWQAWQEYYDADTAALVLEMYERDFELFGYPTAVPAPPAAALPTYVEYSKAPRAAVLPVVRASDYSDATAPAPSENSTLLHEPSTFYERLQKRWAY